MKKIPIIIGPTSSGKTSLAIDLCNKYGGEIISADSRQIYKFMDIGTGKIPVDKKTTYEKKQDCWKINDTIIWGYDLADPAQYFSSFDYTNYALPKIKTLKSRNVTPFLVGGTGFYLNILIGNIKPDAVAPDFNLRSKLEKLSLKALQDILEEEDTLAFQKIDKKNPARLIRAIEKSKNKISNQQENTSYLSDSEYKIIGLTASRDYLYDKADNWVATIWKNGLLEEVEYLINSEYGKSRKLDGIVYKDAKEFLSGNIAKEEAIQRTKYAIHAYIRRQQTYSKKMPNVTWLDVSQDNKTEKVYNIING